MGAKPRRVAGRVRRYLTGEGFLDLRSSESPSRVEGIPFVTILATPMRMSQALPSLEPDSGRIVIHWRVPKGVTPLVLTDEIRIRAVDFVPMLAAWVEQERKNRRV